MTIELLHADCMEYMKGCEDNAFDLALTDPPYGVGFKYGTHNDTPDGYYEWCGEWFSELQRISKCQVLTVGYKNNAYWYSLNPKHAMVWVKNNQCSPSPLGGFNCYELVFVFGKPNNRIGQDVINMPISIQPKAGFHPCPKQVDFWTQLANKFVDADSIIIDPFAGSGTGAIVAHRLGVDFVGCEIDEDYYKAACKRFESETAQLDIFG